MRVEVAVDNRIRLNLAGWDHEEVLEELKRDFTHVNPQREMLRRIGKPHWGEPKTIETWHQDSEDVVSFPRGGMYWVRRRLEDRGFRRRVLDERERGDPGGEDLPDHRLQLYPYQEKAVQAALRQECGIIRAPTGCLTGDTVVTINRAGKGGKMRLDHVVHMFNGGGAAMARGNGLGRPWRTEIPTFVRAPFPDGTVHLARVTGAWVRGSKPVYRVSLVGGWRLNATACHRFMTPSGWRRLDDLSIGDQVLVDVGMGGAEHNNAPENLEVMTHEEHRRQHRGEHLRNIASRLAPWALLAVEYQGERETYDLTVERAEAFIANGIAVHNSGKTSVGFALVGRIKVATLIIVYNAGLFDQWVKRAEKELGMRAEDIGCIRGSKFKLRPLTIAMQQSINARGVDEKLASYFGMVIVDEVQRAAARTMFDAVDPFAARYRFGISADQCVARGTMIVMGDGSERAIEDVREGDTVRTPLGARAVKGMFFTGLLETVRIDVGDRSLRCTRNTRIGTPGGWVFPETLCYPYVYAESHGGTSAGVGQRQDERDRPEACSYLSRDVEAAALHPDSGHAGTSEGHADAGSEGQGEGYGAGAVPIGDEGGVWREALGARQPSANGVGLEGLVVGAGVRTRVLYRDRQRSGSPLGDRLRTRGGEGRVRDRRQQSLVDGAHVARRAEGRLVGESGLGGCAVPGDVSAVHVAGQSCGVVEAQVSDDGIVLPTFDLEVEEAGCFFANRVLIHNTRKDRKEFLTQDLFGGVIEDIKRSDLIKSGHVLDVQVRVVPTDFSAPWYGMASEDEPDLELDTVRLTAEMVDDVGRNELVLAAVMNEVADEQVLVFSHRREHCLVIDRRLVMMGVRTGFLIGGEDYRQEFVKSVAGVEQGSIRVGVGTYQAVGQAIDLPGVGVGVAATPIAANRQVFNQVRGRLCRVAAGKKSARLYYLYDRQVFGRRHLENLVQWNADVVVQENGSWVSAREYLKSF